MNLEKCGIKKLESLGQLDEYFITKKKVKEAIIKVMELAETKETYGRDSQDSWFSACRMIFVELGFEEK